MTIDLTERQKKILDHVVRDYIDRSSPVSSGYLAKNHSLDVSNATIRNELGALTDLGYLRQPHTSAGRVPTEQGYRYFVSKIVNRTELDESTREGLTHQFYKDGRASKQWFQVAARLLADNVQAASLVTAPVSEHKVYKHLELINTHGRWIMMILVKDGGEVGEQMFILDEPFTQVELSATAQYFNHLFGGLNAEQIEAFAIPFSDLEQRIIDLILEDMRRIDSIVIGEVYRAGFQHLISGSGFGDREAVQNALRTLEERPLLVELLSSEVLSDESQDIKVLIGDEGKWETLRHCSVVLARYGDEGVVLGTLGVFGPMPMPYRRTISTVRLVADLLNDVVMDLPADGQ